MKFPLISTGIFLLIILNSACSQDIIPSLNKYNVTWKEPGPTSLQSMPIGNGDIGLNVWAEPTGDICFYIAKTDAWGEETQKRGSWMAEGGVLMKLGLIRISFQPGTFQPGNAFEQILKLKEGEIFITRGTGDAAITVRIWVDANNPVIHVESQSNQNRSIKVELENWRLGAGDKLMETVNAIEWYHQNAEESDTHIRNIVFGATVRGKNFINQTPSALISKLPAKQQSFSIYPLTQTVNHINEWSAALKKLIASLEKQSIEIARAAHLKWWNNFWNRSWVFVSGDSLAEEVTRGYILQRFVTACAGRGAYPIKFNGSVFTVDNPSFNQDGKEQKMDADFREWGGQYWFQNTRAMYWPMLMKGDFEMMLPLFNMYLGMLKSNAKQVREYYGHGGAYFAETSPFWGGLLYMGPEVKENWTGHYFVPILELSMMLLDYYDYTGDVQIIQKYLLPIASAGIDFYDQHFKRDENGKLLLNPVNSIEMFWKVHNPAPDIAGLHAVLGGLLKLPRNLVGAEAHEKWHRLQKELPSLPMGKVNGVATLLPYAGPQTVPSHNSENPELYSVYPYRIYGIDKPGLELARNTFNQRRFKDKGCWAQDPVQAAMLGLSEVAREYVAFNFTRKAPALKFPAFWARGNDYAPDQDNGGNGENGLQQMLMYTDGKKIILMPAWPKGWNARFKLHAPQNTIIQGVINNGKIENLRVWPGARQEDVLIERKSID